MVLTISARKITNRLREPISLLDTTVQPKKSYTAILWQSDVNDDFTDGQSHEFIKGFIDSKSLLRAERYARCGVGGGQFDRLFITLGIAANYVALQSTTCNILY